ncbi:MAG: BON domain-containing protein [Gammaproteobacteria bacterium]|nr:BON domain-containing protein [Gammaproteobacteria bacterium]MCP5137253.1 BON domain-containing protein [Gammaproteobacteria bacterium]
MTARSLKNGPRTTLLLGLIAALLCGCAPVIIGGAAATGGAVAHDRRTTGSVVEDQTIGFKIRDRLNPQNGFTEESSDIGISSFNGLVLLTGTVTDNALRQRAETQAREVEKVRIVYNEIRLGPPSSMQEDADDLFITTQAKAELFHVEGQGAIDPLRVSVTTVSGTVYLMGLLTRAEADAVTEEIRHIGGVNKVIRLFEYLD